MPYGCCNILVIIRSEIEHIFRPCLRWLMSIFRRLLIMPNLVPVAQSEIERAVFIIFAILVNLAVNLVTQPSKMRRGGGNWLTRVQHQTLRTSNYLNFLISFNWKASNACWSNVAYSLKAFAYRTIVIEPFKNKLRTGWPNWFEFSPDSEFFQVA